MSKVVALMSMSLDGYVADLNDGVAEVFDWYFSGDVEFQVGGTDPMTFRVSQSSADHLHGLISEIGAILAVSAAEGLAGLRGGGVGLRRAYWVAQVCNADARNHGRVAEDDWGAG